MRSTRSSRRLALCGLTLCLATAAAPAFAQDAPTGDAAAYHPTFVYFDRVGEPSWGMPAGHWRQMSRL